MKLQEEKQISVERLLCDLNGRLVSTNSQLEDCMLRIKEKNVSPHDLKSTNSQLNDLRFSLENNIRLLQEQKQTHKLKRRRKEEESFLKKKEKIGIFIHVVGEFDTDGCYETASCLYKIEMNSEYKNRFSRRKWKRRNSIEPVFRFTFEQGYPLGMACVNFGSKHHLYLMGGSITYNYFLTKSTRYAFESYKTVNTTEPNMYPPDVYVIDCFTCQVLSPRDSPPPMNSGKSAHPFTFVENNKLYVLSSTKLFEKLHMFEVFDPDSRTWTVLDDPPSDWGKLDTPIGSVLINGVFFISYAQDSLHKYSPIHIFSYKIANKEWNKKLTVSRPLDRSISVPSFVRDSLFVHSKIFSANVRESMLDFPILSYGPIPSTDKLYAHDFDGVGTPNLTQIFPSDACWPIYGGRVEDDISARLVHLGGLLEGTKIDSTFFGFVQVVEPVDDLGCHISFAAFEAAESDFRFPDFRLPDGCGSFFRAKSLHTCHFYSGKFQQSCVNAAYALVLS